MKVTKVEALDTLEQIERIVFTEIRAINQRLTDESGALDIEGAETRLKNLCDTLTSIHAAKQIYKGE